MESLDHWRLCDDLTVIEATLLFVGIDPSSEEGSRCESSPPHEQPKGYDATKAALCHAIEARKLRAKVRHDAEPRYVAGLDYGQGGDVFLVKHSSEEFVVTAEVNWSKTTIAVDDLRECLAKRGVKSGFFFPLAPDAPDYLDPIHERYAPKLAAAVSAWLAVDDPLGKTPKQALTKWLREHCAEYGLSDDEGNPNEQGIDDCAKVANWQPGGGSPKTPVNVV